MNKKIKNKMEGSALLLTIMILASIFIIAAGSAYMSMTSMAKTSKFTDNLKAKQKALAGSEKFLYEFRVLKLYSLEDPCLGPDSPIFSFYDYKVYCDSGNYYSLGSFKNSRSLIKIDVE